MRPDYIWLVNNKNDFRALQFVAEPTVHHIQREPSDLTYIPNGISTAKTYSLVFLDSPTQQDIVSDSTCVYSDFRSHLILEINKPKMRSSNIEFNSFKNIITMTFDQIPSWLDEQVEDMTLLTLKSSHKQRCSSHINCILKEFNDRSVRKLMGMETLSRM